MFGLLEVTERSSRLSVVSGGVSVRGKDDPCGHFFPLDSIHAVIMEECAVSVTGKVLSSLAESGIILICCNSNHLPVGILWPALGHGAEAIKTENAQIAASIPFKKRLWKILIQRKIKGQSTNLNKFRNSCLLDGLHSLIKSADSDHQESRASVIYWRTLNLFPKRKRCAADNNAFFNYMYTVLYAAFARHICASGLNPKMGIWHHHRDNPCCLASDLMEPFRPLVDTVVIETLDLSDLPGQLSPSIRAGLLQRLYAMRLRLDRRNESFSFFEAVRMTVQSYKRALLANHPEQIMLPETVVKTCG